MAHPFPSTECERGETDDEGIERDSGDSEDELDRSANFTMADALQVSGGQTGVLQVSRPEVGVAVNLEG